MTNDVVEIARRFHDDTMHTPSSIRTSTHTLEWDIKPFPFKIYPDAPAVPLPRDLDAIGVPTLAAVSGAGPVPVARLTLPDLAALLYHSAGVTKKKAYPGGGEVLFRAAPSTGALYQTEVYVVAGEVDGLAAGVYHFCPGDFTLRRLREGDLRGAVAAAAADPTLARRAATLVLTAIYWRNTWKYQARGFRHLYWDSGSMLANGLATGNALGLTPRLVAGFVDTDVHQLLGLDADREAALELVAVGPEGAAAPSVDVLPVIDPAVMPLSQEEVDYPALREMQHASMLDSADAVRAWRARAAPSRPGPLGAVAPLPPVNPRAGRSLGDTIQRRGSTRRFGHMPLTADELSAALGAATRGVPADVPAGLVDLYLVVNAVEGVAPGAYAVWPDAGLELLQRGDLRRRSAYLCLEQALGGDAAAVIYVLTPLDALLASFGNRGYRLANLQAGLAGGRAYLAAYALGFGASGLTFYDQEVVQLFAPHAAGKDAIFVTALGRAATGATDVLVSTRAIQPKRS